MINIAVGGAQGRIGLLITQAIKIAEDLQLSGEVSRQGNHSSIADIKMPTDVFIDFSVPVALSEHLKICRDRQYRMVIGVTGYTETQKKDIQKAAEDIPIVLSPNMSIGINLSYKILELIAKTLPEHTDIAILDIHHKLKKDKPSGTALQMANTINNALGKTSQQSKISFSSLRMGDTIAEASALFALEGERLEITHRTLDRLVFVRGALQAARWVMDQPCGLYDMQDVLGLS